MCKPGAACGCGQSSPLPAAAIIATAGVVVVSGAAAALTDAAVAILAVLGVAIAASLAVLVFVLRRGETLWRPQGRAALPATRTPAALPASQPRAIEARRSVIPGFPVEDVRSERI